MKLLQLCTLFLQTISYCNSRSVDKVTSDSLPRNVIVNSYNLLLNPVVNFRDFTSSSNTLMFGNVEINFCLTEDSDSFEIASGTTVNITETVVTGPIGVVPHSYYSKGKDHLLFNLTDIYEAKTCFKLNATFQSLLTDQKEGVFRWCNGQQK